MDAGLIMNIEDYINTIFQQIEKLANNGVVVFHLCIYRRKLAVRESIHSRQNRCVILHVFTNDEIEHGCTSKTWSRIKEAILIRRRDFDNE